MERIENASIIPQPCGGIFWLRLANLLFIVVAIYLNSIFSDGDLEIGIDAQYTAFTGKTGIHVEF